MEFGIIRQCRGDAFVVYPKEVLHLDMDRCAAKLRSSGLAVNSHGVMTSVIFKGRTVTLYPTGRVLIVPCGNKEEAVKVAEDIFRSLRV